MAILPPTHPMAARALAIAIGLGLAPWPRAAAQEPGTKEKVLGIGGFFFRSRDPAALARWYNEHLGVSPVPTSYQQKPWQQEAGFTVFNPFPDTTKYFGSQEKVWLLNFRVRSLHRMVAQLERAGIKVKVDPQTYPNGRFARLHDPEGNPIELWEPK
jgi:glyoxylase I family protein